MAVKRKMQTQEDKDPTALYVADLPSTWKAEDVYELHKSNGLGGASLSSVKMLPRKLSGETGCAILRYLSPQTASRAMEVMNGMITETLSGQQKAIKARFADRDQSATKPHKAGPATPLRFAAQMGETLPARNGADANASGSSLPSVYLTEVPSEFSEQTLRSFHSSLGLGQIASLKFLPRKINNGAGSVMLRYSTTVAAQQAVARLNGHPINTSNGTVRYLIAKLADPPKGHDEPQLVLSPSGARPPPQEAPPANCDPTSLYLADLPVGLDQTALHRLHADARVEIPESVKFLPPKLDGESCCAILRYADPEAARQAIGVLHSMSVLTRTGKQKQLTARYAAQKRSDGTEDDNFKGNAFQPTLGSNTSSSYEQAGTDDHSGLPSVYVSDLPGDISEDGIRQVLVEASLDSSLLMAVKFLPRKIQASSICALLRYGDMSSVTECVSMLHGHQVILPGGGTRNLIAKVADPPKSRGAEVDDGFSNSAALAASAPTSLMAAGLTDLYLSEVPVEWGEDYIIGFHAEIGADPATVTNVKILERRHISYPTGAAIVRYVDHQSALNAKQLLEGRPVSIPGGQRQLVVRFADPPKRTKTGGR